MRKLIRNLYSALDTHAKRLTGLMFIAMTLVTALETLSIGLLLPVIQIVLLGQPKGPGADAVTWMIAEIGGDHPGVVISAVFAAVFLIKNIFLLLLLFWINQTIGNINAAYMDRVFTVYLEKPLEFHLTRNSADLIRNILVNTRYFFEVIRLILMVVLDLLTVIAILALIITVAPGMSFAVGALLGTISGLYIWIAGPHLKRWGTDAMVGEGEVIKLSSLGMNAVRDVKLARAAHYFGATMAGIAHRWRRAYANQNAAIHIPRLLVETVVILAFATLAGIYGLDGGDAREGLPILGLFAMAGLRLIPSINRILSSLSQIRTRAPYIDAVVEDLIDARDCEMRRHRPSNALPAFNDTIRLERVGYRYPEGSGPALDTIDLTIRKGERIGVVGPSGAGKSTLMDIVLTLLEPQNGRVLLDGKPLNRDLSSFFDLIGFVPQMVTVVDDTLRRNVAFGIPDDEIDVDALQRALNLSHLDEVIASLPEGDATVLGEYGVRLSGGQRQRIAIARALYRDPPILLFDEATAALDNETEREITKAIHRMGQDRTIVIIAHRLSTVRDCDRIVVMEAGKVVAEGKYDDLLASSPLFARLARGTT